MILVFKDCQIIEQVSHKQLLELNGVFVGMWANQITAAGGLSVDGGLREPVSVYQKIDDAIPSSDKPVTVDINTAPTQNTTEPETEAPVAPTEDTTPAQNTVLEWSAQDLLSPDRSAAAAMAGTQVYDAATNRLSDLVRVP